MDLGLRDRVVLITGAGGGAGPTVARAFADEGAIVALNHRPGSGSAARAEAAAAEIVAAGGRAMAVAADLDSTDQITAMFERVATELGPVGVLVTATSAYKSERFGEITDASWSAVVDDLLGATFRTCRAAVPGMQSRGLGPDRQRRGAVRAGRNRAGDPLRGGEGRHRRADRVAGQGARSGRDPRQRGRPDPDPDRQGRGAVDPRRSGRRDGQDDPAAPPGHAR